MRKSPTPIELSLAEARQLIVASQGLDRSAPFGLGKAAALAAIEHLGYVQIDTISVIERAHHHVLWNRIPEYEPAHLHQLQALDRSIFEYWSHAAAFLPMRDYRFARVRMHEFAEGKRHWFRRDRKLHEQVLARIRAEGPLLSKDFEAPANHKGGKWFEWKPSKKALEQLFWSGALMIRERQGFQKVFDLTERILPPGTNTSMPSADEYLTYLIRSALRAQGMAAEAEIRYQRSVSRPKLEKLLSEMCESGEIQAIRVPELGQMTYYALRASFERSLSEAAPRTPEDAQQMRLLSPFDNLVIQRKRISKFFGFNYQMECYVPEAKRKFGYFCLPILAGTNFVGRVDLKADRASHTLHVLSLHWEGEAKSTKNKTKLTGPLQRALVEFANFNKCECVKASRQAAKAGAIPVGKRKQAVL